MGATPASAAPRQGANRFEHAVLIPGDGISTGTTRHATKQAGEPEHADNPGGASVWFRWRATSEHYVRFSTRGSEFDTLLAVYQGTDLGHLHQVAASDDFRGPESEEHWSRVEFRGEPGVVYRIVIDGYNLFGGDPPAVERGRYVLHVLTDEDS